MFNRGECEREAIRNGEASVTQKASASHELKQKRFLCPVGLPRSCDFLISFYMKFILSMPHCLTHFSKAQSLRGQTQGSSRDSGQIGITPALKTLPGAVGYLRHA